MGNAQQRNTPADGDPPGPSVNFGFAYTDQDDTGAIGEQADGKLRRPNRASIGTGGLDSLGGVSQAGVPLTDLRYGTGGLGVVPGTHSATPLNDIEGGANGILTAANVDDLVAWPIFLSASVLVNGLGIFNAVVDGTVNFVVGIYGVTPNASGEVTDLYPTTLITQTAINSANVGGFQIAPTTPAGPMPNAGLFWVATNFSAVGVLQTYNLVNVANVLGLAVVGGVPISVPALSVPFTFGVLPATFPAGAQAVAPPATGTPVPFLDLAGF